MVLALAVALLAACSVLPLGDAQSTYTLAVLGTGFIRGQLMGVDSTNAECTLANQNAATCFGGCDGRLNYIDSVRASNPNTLVVDAGRFVSTLASAETINRASKNDPPFWFFFNRAFFSSLQFVLGLFVLRSLQCDNDERVPRAHGLRCHLPRLG